ncbi:MAG TPA: DUF899 family protein [Polyangiaceae bacterium]
MSVRFPGESAEYRAARLALLEQETALRTQMEAVAIARRALPPGGLVPTDYVFEGETGAVRLSELFTGDHTALAIYSMMFPRDPSDTRAGATSGETAKLALVDAPCPSCTALLDQLDGMIEHTAPHVDFVVVAKAPITRVLTFAKERGWRRLRMLSWAGTTYGRDYHGETPEGAARPMLNVFRRSNGEIRHFWGSELLYAPSEPGQDPRHVGTLEPMWNLFDLTPEGRGAQWEEQLAYGDSAAHCCAR